MAFEAVAGFVPGGAFGDITNIGNADFQNTNVFDVTQNDAAALFALGTEVECVDTTNVTRARFIYARGVANMVDTDAVIIKHGDNAAILLDNLNLNEEIGAIGFAMAAVVAAEYGWFQVWGRAEANVAANFGEGADDGVFTTTTAGTVDDTAGGGQIMGARAESAIDTPATGTAYVDIWYPFCPGTGGTWV